GPYDAPQAPCAGRRAHHHWQRNIARQKKTIAELEVHDATTLPAARQTLADFEHTQEMFLTGLQQIKQELEKSGLACMLLRGNSFIGLWVAPPNTGGGRSREVASRYGGTLGSLSGHGTNLCGLVKSRSFTRCERRGGVAG